MEKNKKAIVLYGSKGLIGKSILDKVVNESNFDIIIAIDFVDDISQNSRKYVINPDGISFINLDVTCDEQLTSFYECLNTNETFKVHAFINASYPKPTHWGKDFRKLTMQDFNKSLSFTLGSYFAIANYSANYFISRDIPGKHIGFSSIYGIMPPRFEIYENTDINMPIEYAASKSALININKYFVKFYAKNGLVYNLISPGGVYNNHDDAFIANYTKHTGIIGMLSAGNIADVSIYLLSDKSIGINGQNIIIDDGFSL